MWARWFDVLWVPVLLSLAAALMTSFLHRVWVHYKSRERLELARKAEAHAAEPVEVPTTLKNAKALLRERLKADAVVLREMEATLMARLSKHDLQDAAFLNIVCAHQLANIRAQNALDGIPTSASRPLAGRPGGYGRRGLADCMLRDAHPAGCLVTITIRGRSGSGRSSLASLIEATLTGHGVAVVDNTDHDVIGIVQAIANVRRIGADLTVVIRSGTVS